MDKLFSIEKFIKKKKNIIKELFHISVEFFAFIWEGVFGASYLC